MLAVYLSPIYILVNVYLLFRILKWLGTCFPVMKKRESRILISLVYCFFALSILVAFFMPMSGARRIMKLIGNYWLGVLLAMVLFIVAADIIRFLLFRSKALREKLHSEKIHKIVGLACMAGIVVFCVWGAVNARIIHVTPYEITVEKDAGDLKELNVVLVGDLHIGYNIGASHMEKMVEKINAQDADIVVIAGDIFDNEYEAVAEPERIIEILKEIRSEYGVYACYGNHDIQEPILAGFTFGRSGKKESSPEMDEFLKKADIRLLRDEAVLIADSVYLYGRPDEERPGRGIDVRKTGQEIMAELDASKPVIVIDHEPKELAELAEAGVDVDLCGHTHDGQIFPGNLTTKLVWENSCGYLKKGNMHNIVTSGVGLFGPYMRVGTKAEICTVKINFRA